MKYTLRTTLLTILTTLVTFTVFAQGISSFRTNRKSARELLAQILTEMAEHIYGRVHQVLDTASDLSKLNRMLLETGPVNSKEFPRLAEFWLDMMAVSPELSFVGLTLEETGEMVGVARTANGQLRIQEIRRHPEEENRLELRDFRPSEYPHEAFYFDPDYQAPNLRDREWYSAADKQRRQIWTPTYLFIGERGEPSIPGTTCSVPVLAPDGSLAGVANADVDVHELCSYLKRLSVGNSGFAFIVELRDDGMRPVIALPDESQLLRNVTGPDGKTIRELIPASQIKDARIRTFMENLPTEIVRGDNARFMPVSFKLDSTKYVGGFRYVRGQDTPEWLICILLPENDVMQDIWQNNVTNAMIGSSILLLAILVSLYVSRQVAQPLEKLAMETQAIGHLHVEPRTIVHSIVREVDDLAIAVEEMKRGLRSFTKFVPADLVRNLYQSGKEASLGGEQRTVTISFSDIVNFTGISEQMTPQQLVDHLRDYLNSLSTEIVATRGTVDKYIGDAVMAFWGAPNDDPDHALGACTSALRSQAALRELRPIWKAAGRPELSARIGINTGEVVVGNIGSEVRLNYTVIGDAVNLSSRLEGLNKEYGTEIIISEATYEAVKNAVVARLLDWVSVKGKTNVARIYELLGFSHDSDPSLIELCHRYTEALNAYRVQNWNEAIQLLDGILANWPDDPPSQRLRARCLHFQQNPPPADWDGVHRFDHK